MIIEKTPKDHAKLFRKYFAFPNARSAMKAFLSAIELKENEEVMLPGYIGWSSREGSGVFDPIKELKLPYCFYRISNDLEIDIEHAENLLKARNIRVLLLIHYYGFVDPNACQLAEMARNKGCLVLEDEAHAMLTDLIGGRAGRFGDAAIFSLHKLLPLRIGGALLLNNIECCRVDKLRCLEDPDLSLWQYDLKNIADTRVRNGRKLIEMLKTIKGVRLLRDEIKDGEVPQTIPILLEKCSRDDVYHDLNNRGYGVVSLYHSLISEIDISKHPSSKYLSAKILNLPVHQDISEEQVEYLVKELQESIKRASAY